LIENREYRFGHIDSWLEDCATVDGSTNDLDLLRNIKRVFNVFDSLKSNYQDQIIPAVSKMAKGMAHFQGRFQFGEITPLENEEDLEEYCYFVAGVVGEMLCDLFLQKMTTLPESSRRIMKENAVSFGLGLQMTNISKDVMADRKRGWSYIPQSLIAANGLTVDEFHSGKSVEKNLQILEKLLFKTNGHLHDALKFILAIPRTELSLRLFCIWPLWMAMKTVAALHNNPALLSSSAPVKISRSQVKRILLGTPLIAWSNFLLGSSFNNILGEKEFDNHPKFDLEYLQKRLAQISLDDIPSNIQST
jgi:farnesyl-diphosphate farnesyltransferase